MNVRLEFKDCIFCSGKFLRISVLILFWLLAFCNLGSAPYKPKSDDEVLQATVQTRVLRAKGVLRTPPPASLEEALIKVRSSLEEAQRNFDPRFIAYADNLLDVWKQVGEENASYWVALGMVHQSRHEFERSLVDLDKALRLRPKDPQALITRTIVLQVLGRFKEAKLCCFKLNGLASPLYVSATAANLASLTGQGSVAIHALESILDRDAQKAGKDELLWAYTSAAEIYTRLNQMALAEDAFLKALKILPEDAYTIGAYSDLLLRMGRFAEAVQLLHDHQMVDGLFLRYVIAQKKLESPGYKSEAVLLESRLKSSLVMNPTGHLREYARFLLDVKNEPESALEAALRNWEVQKEPADADLLLSSAIASNRPEKAHATALFAREMSIPDLDAKAAIILKNAHVQ